MFHLFKHKIISFHHFMIGRKNVKTKSQYRNSDENENQN